MTNTTHNSKIQYITYPGIFTTEKTYLSHASYMSLSKLLYLDETDMRYTTPFYQVYLANDTYHGLWNLGEHVADFDSLERAETFCDENILHGSITTPTGTISTIIRLHERLTRIWENTGLMIWENSGVMIWENSGVMGREMRSCVKRIEFPIDEETTLFIDTLKRNVWRRMDEREKNGIPSIMEEVD